MCTSAAPHGRAFWVFLCFPSSGHQKRLIGTPPGPRRGEEEERRRRRRGGEEDTFHSQGLGTLRMASRRASHARTTRTRNTISRFPPSTSEILKRISIFLIDQSAIMQPNILNTCVQPEFEKYVRASSSHIIFICIDQIVVELPFITRQPSITTV